MKWIHRQSFAKKLAYHAMATASISLVLASAGFMTYDLISVRRTILKHLTQDAETIGVSSMAAIRFKDRETVTEILSLLRNKPRIIGSCVYLENRELFSTYMRKGESIDFPALPDNLTQKFSKGYLELFRPIILDNQRIGAVYIKRDLQDMRQRLWNYALIVVIVLFTSLIVAMLSSVQIQRILSQPIDELVQSAKTITDKKDYSIRAKKISQDELGMLTDVFNNMLQQIQARDLSLRASEERFRTIYENAPVMMNAFNEDLLCILWNRECEKTFGWTMEEINAHDKPLSLFYPDSKVQQQVMESITSKPEGIFKELHPLTKDRSERITLWANFRLPDGAVINLGYDITERKLAETELSRLNKELTEKNREMEQVVYATSHDLRSPLVNIQGFSGEMGELLNDTRSFLKKEKISPSTKNKINPILEDEIPKALERIIKNTDKIDTLLSGLLRLSRVGKVELNFSLLDMNMILSDIVEASKFQIQKKATDVNISDLPPCFGDKSQIDQVFSNLIGNALKYLSPDRKGLIRVTGRKENKQIVYCVEDNGLGIHEDFQKIIFELFHRLDPKASVGEGLGLNIVSKIIQRHCGNIWVESQPGRGSKFFVSLPNKNLWKITPAKNNMPQSH